MGKQLAFHVDMSRCTGCKACQIACKDKNNLPVGTLWRRVLEYSGGSWVQQGGFYLANNVSTSFIAVGCMHCEKPICAQVCPAAAITKRDDGVVILNRDQCIGCRYCAWACPYGAPAFIETAGTMSKCDFCSDLLAQGEKPACVDGCPFRALDFGELSELRAKYGSLSDPAPLPDPNITGPAIVYTPSRTTQVAGKGGGQVMNVEFVRGVK